MRRLKRVIQLLIVSLGVWGCEDKPKPPPPAASDSASAKATPPVRRIPVPIGPRLAVLAGKGVGAIRLGATLATVERHMDASCPQRDGQRCVYPRHALIFEFGPDDKGLERVLIHRQGRALPGGEEAGVFNGVIPPDLAFGMLVSAMQQDLGPPKKVIPGAEGAHSATSEQHVYDGMVLEYEKLDNGNTVLGGIRIPK